MLRARPRKSKIRPAGYVHPQTWRRARCDARSILIEKHLPAEYRSKFTWQPCRTPPAPCRGAAGRGRGDSAADLIARPAAGADRARLRPESFWRDKTPGLLDALRSGVVGIVTAKITGRHPDLDPDPGPGPPAPGRRRPGPRPDPGPDPSAPSRYPRRCRWNSRARSARVHPGRYDHQTSNGCC